MEENALMKSNEGPCSLLLRHMFSNLGRAFSPPHDDYCDCRRMMEWKTPMNTNKGSTTVIVSLTLFVDTVYSNLNYIHCMFHCFSYAIAYRTHATAFFWT